MLGSGHSLCLEPFRDLPLPLLASGGSRLPLAGSVLADGERLLHGAELIIEATEAALLALRLSAGALLALLPRVLRLALSGRLAVAAKQPAAGAGATRTCNQVSPSGSTCSDLPCERAIQADMDLTQVNLSSIAVVLKCFDYRPVSKGFLLN